MNRNTLWSLLVAAALLVAGCLDDDDDVSTPPPPEAEPYAYAMDPALMEDVRNYSDLRPFTLEELDDRDWAVFKREHGGNCCEHYLASTKEGWIVNLGGEYPIWSEDRGETWNKYVPTILPSGLSDQHELCRTLEPSGLEDWEGLGEGSVVQATNGDLLAMSWYPYPAQDGKADRFYAYLYRADFQEWGWCQNNWHEPFYDRSWQVEVKGPITTDPNGLPTNKPWATIVISNFWHQSMNEGGTISVDGLNYYRLDFPGRNGNPNPVEFELNFTDLGVEWDYAMPHREMRAIPLPGPENGGPAGALFPRYFSDGDNLWLDTDLNWHRHRLPSGTQIPSEYLWLDSSGTLHSLDLAGTSLVHWMSTDGANNWTGYNHTWPTAQRIDEWEFQVDGRRDLALVYMRVQEQDDLCPQGTCDRDLLFEIRDYSLSPEADRISFLGLGDKDSTSGAGNEVRFDFASLAILPDGGAVVSYHDSTDEDPIFAVELELPERYFEAVG